MIFGLRLIILLICIGLILVMVRGIFPRTEIVAGKPVKNKYLMLASVATILVLIVFVAGAEYITRL